MGAGTERKKGKNMLDLLHAVKKLKNVWEIYLKMKLVQCLLAFHNISSLPNVIVFLAHERFKNDRLPNPLDFKMESKFSFILNSSLYFLNHHFNGCYN